MKGIKIESGKFLSIKTDYYVLPVFEGRAGAAGEYENVMKTALAGKKARKEFLKKTILCAEIKGERKDVFAVGLGKKQHLTREKIRQAAGFVAGEMKSLGAGSYAVMPWADDPAGIKAQAEGHLLASYIYPGIKNRKENVKAPRVIMSAVKNKNNVRKIIAEVSKISGAVFGARDLMNLPSNYATPSFIEKKAREIAAQSGKIKIKVISKQQALKMGMGGFYSVARGSDEPAKFIVLEYRGGKKGERPVALVGKGITFDSGGISLKPQASGAFKIEDMKYDMSGAAAVLYALKAAVGLNIKRNITAVIAATENLPSGNAYKPGDVIKTLSGITVEVISTDAEGRMVLADAITYAGMLKPDCIIDVATLTGGCVVALGHYATGLMTNDRELGDILKTAGEESGDRVWELPLWEEYGEQIKSGFADIKNVGGADGAAITAGRFLKEFAVDTPWAHLDIAGSAYGVKNKTYIPGGVSAAGVRLLVEFLKNFRDKG